MSVFFKLLFSIDREAIFFLNDQFSQMNIRKFLDFKILAGKAKLRGCQDKFYGPN